MANLNPEDRWPAPAKINRFLRIVGRRDDGYHQLQTVFQFIDLCDYLAFRIRDDGLIRLHYRLPGVNPDHDLCLRAAQLLKIHNKITLGADIFLHKRIPMGGGLGGGSSNAATVLYALNYYWHCNLSTKILAGLGVRLGADVPVFIHGQAAWAEGIGEQLTPLRLDEPWAIVVTPPCLIPTQAVFTAPNLTRNSRPIEFAPLSSIVDSAGNDCESVVFDRFPVTTLAARWLSNFGTPRLSGTGSSLFCIVDRNFDLKQALALLPANFKVFITRIKNFSPLQAKSVGDRMPG